MAEPTRVALLGSTGSIGRQTLDVLDHLGHDFTVVALAAGRDRKTLERQAARHRPLAVHLAQPVGVSLDVPAGVTVEHGADALERLAMRDDVDLVVVATAGIVSLRPVLTALAGGKVVAIANKETLVAGGHLVMPLVKRLAGETGDPLHWLRPIDSEHSAIWQCLVGERRRDVERLIITASGGPFRGWSADQLARATPADALAHPTWSMGAKVTIDSATLINKGLEVIEACWLYDVEDAKIDVVVHPQSIIHSMIEFADGSLKAQLGLPDMRIPIQYALTFPARVASPAARTLPGGLPALTFEAPDEGRFPGLAIAREAGRRGPRASAALIAADEIAVHRFLEGSLAFDGIPELVAGAVEEFGTGSDSQGPDLEQLIELDAATRAWAATARPVRAS